MGGGNLPVMLLPERTLLLLCWLGPSSLLPVARVEVAGAVVPVAGDFPLCLSVTSLSLVLLMVTGDLAPPGVVPVEAVGTAVVVVCLDLAVEWGWAPMMELTCLPEFRSYRQLWIWKLMRHSTSLHSAPHEK